MLIDYNQIVSTFSRPFPSSFCRSGWTSVGRWMSWATWNNVRRLGGLTWDSPGTHLGMVVIKPMENPWKTYGKHTKTYGKSPFLLWKTYGKSPWNHINFMVNIQKPMENHNFY